MPTIEKTIEKINSFAELPSGWRFGEGGAISAGKISFAVNLILYAENLGITRANAFAGSDLELLISFYFENKSIDLTFEADGSITFAADCDGEQVGFQENLTLKDAYDKIWQFQNQTTSESFIQRTTTRKAESFQALHSNLRLTAVSRSSIRTVPKKQVAQYASTLPNSTQIRRPYPKSIGTSQRTEFRRRVS